MLIPMQRPGAPAGKQKDGDDSGTRNEGMCAIETGEGDVALRKPARRAPLESAEDREGDPLQKRQEKHKRSGGQLK